MTPLALGLGFAAAHVALHGWPPLRWSLSLKQWLAYAVPFAGILGALTACLPRLRLPAALGLSVAAPVLLLDFMLEHHWEGSERWLWPAMLAAGLFATLLAFEGLATRRPGALLPMLWFLTSTLTSVALLLSRSASLAQLGGAVSAALGVVVVLALWERRFSLARGGAAVLGFLHVTLLWAGHFASELSGTSALLLGVAPLLPWVGELTVLATRPRLRRGATVLCVVAAAGATLYLEWPAPDPYAGYGR